jgi:HEAT repeat protein
VILLPNLLNDLTGGNETRAEAAVLPLIDLGEKGVLLDLTRSSDADHRWWGLRVLAQSPYSQAEWLTPFLNDGAREVRQCAALGLALKPAESAIQPLIQVLSDEDGMVASLAVNALVKTGSAAVPALIEVAKAAPQSARIHALRAGRLRDPAIRS